MPLETHFALISTIKDKQLAFKDLSDATTVWESPPPPYLTSFKYYRCRCRGPSSGYQIGIKYDGMICKIDVTAWGISVQKSTPTYQDMEIIQITESAPYRLEIVFL
jgi:hypothetical protein